MALRTIRTEDDPCLYKKCREVDAFNERLSELIDDMFDTMYAADGAGLAASQVGVLKRVVVIDADGEDPMELVNPEIVSMSGTQGGMEGCLSFPGKQGYVVRPNHVRVQAYDRNGDLYEYEGEELFARAILHENDHLDGLIYTRLVTDPPEGYKEEELEYTEPEDDTEEEK